MSVCKYCKTEILWIRMRSGKAMPCNVGEILYRAAPNGPVKLVTAAGTVISAVPWTDRDSADGIGYVSHYATCPGADRFRRR